MRQILIAIALLYPIAADAEIEPAACGNLASIFRRLADANSSAEQATRGTNFAPVINQGDGSVRSAAIAAQGLRDKAAEAARAYRLSLEKLANQLQACAR